jgi:hypothetical protein
MSVYDARAARMWPSFERRPNMRPYEAIQPKVVPFGAPGAPINGATAPLALVSAQMNFSEPDRAPEDLLSEATWKSIRGARSEMPEPRHILLMPPGPGDD